MTSPKPLQPQARPHCNGSEDRVGEIYEMYASRIAAYALRRTNRADAADVVAETFLVAWRRRDVMPSEPMTLPWLYGVARRVLANQARANQRQGRLHERLTSQFTHCESPSSYVEVAEGFERVAKALKKLPADDVEVLRLTAWEALSPSEIASVMDLQPEAVRQRLHRARKRLRKLLGAESVERRSVETSRRGRAGALGQPGPALIWDLSDPRW